VKTSGHIPHYWAASQLHYLVLRNIEKKLKAKLGGPRSPISIFSSVRACPHSHDQLTDPYTDF
jgi:hypothetical protein